MRIAIVMPRTSRMGRDRLNSMETVALTLARSSAYRNSIVIVCEEGAEVCAAPDMTVRVPGGLGKTLHAQTVLAVLRDLRPDIVEFHQQLETSARLARRLGGTPCVLHRHTRIKPPRHLLDGLRYQARLKAFDRVVLVSEAAREEFLRDYPALCDRAAVVCNPIDMAPWRAEVEQKERIILFSGRAMPEKGLDAFCQALAETLDKAPYWRGALMLGDWERHAQWAEPHVRRLDRFGDRVTIATSAPISAVQDITRRAAIAVTPSRVAEAMGLSALEAHAAGAALISSGRGGLKEASGPHAVYVDPPDAAALARALRELTDDDDRRVTLAREGQAFVARTHSPETRARELDSLREQILAAENPMRQTKASGPASRPRQGGS